MLAINPKIKQKAEDIRKKIFGAEVRESLASGIEAISEDVEATIGRQDYVEEQFQDVLDETTGKDVISAPEIIAARNGKSYLKTRLDDEHAQVTAQLQQIVTLIDRFPRLNNETEDGARIQRAIDYLSENGGGVLRLTDKDYTVVGSITLRDSVIIEGANYINVNQSLTTTTITHTPNAPNIDLFITGVGGATGTLSGVGLRNLYLQGTNNSIYKTRYGINLNKINGVTLENIRAVRLVDGLVISEIMNANIINVDIQSCSNACLRIHGSISTTIVFDHCYFHVSKIPVILEKGTCLGVKFKDCIFESCPSGLDIHTGNHVVFDNPYSENIPSDASASYIMNFGINGADEAVYSRGSCVITGGALMGFNGNIPPSSGIFNVDRWASLVIIGPNVGRANKLIATTPKTKNVILEGVFMQQTTDTVLPPGVLGLRNTIGGTVTTIDFGSSFKTSGWTVTDQYGYSGSDIDFRIGNGEGTKVFGLDSKKNIKHNFNGTPGSVEGADLFGAIPLPNFAGLPATAGVLWAETIDGVTRLRTRNSENKISDLGTYTCGASTRPATPYIGKQAFDVTLNKPIWCKSVNPTVWIDATGTIV